MVDQTNESTFLICVPRKEQKGFYRVQTIWNENELKLTLLDNSIAYNSILSKNQLASQAEMLGMVFKDYIEKVLSGLQSDNYNSYLYERKNDTFLIYRQQKALKIILSKFILQEVNYVETIENLIDNTRIISHFYKDRSKGLEIEINNLNAEKNDVKQKLERFIILKENTENELYSKFILILNEKKKHIAYLTDLLQSYKKGIFQEKCTDFEEREKIENNKNKKFKNNKVEMAKKLETISDSGSETEIEDDFDKETQVQIDINTEMKRKFDLLDGDSDLSTISIPRRSTENISAKNEINIKLADQCIIESKSKKSKKEEESQDLEELFASNETILSMQSNYFQNDATETPNFCTQDLLDRM